MPGCAFVFTAGDTRVYTLRTAYVYYKYTYRAYKCTRLSNFWSTSFVRPYISSLSRKVTRKRRAFLRWSQFKRMEIRRTRFDKRVSCSLHVTTSTMIAIIIPHYGPIRYPKNIDNSTKLRTSVTSLPTNNTKMAETSIPRGPSVSMVRFAFFLLRW